LPAQFGGTKCIYLGTVPREENATGAQCPAKL
jgi:hypothetical protein